MASRLNDKNNKKLQQKNEKILEEMSKMPGNNHCCDCGATGPRWASFNIGCFLCIKCGGIHRKMGTHISKVKSISLDSWTPEQIQNMQEWGNEKVNQHYLPNGETRKIPSDPIGMEQYIRDKYEHQVFRRGSGSRSRSSSTRNEVTDSPPSSFNAMHTRASNALVKLRDMGFTNVELNKRILSQTQMDVNAAIEILCNLPDEEPSQLKQLQAMGFDNAAKCGAALRKAGGDLDRAIELLVQDRELRKAQADRNGTPKSSRSHSKSNAPLPEPPRQATKPKQDIFASAEDDQDDDFGDFQSTTASAAEPATSSKDYIMSLFESNPPQPTQASVPQNAFNMGNAFGQPSQSNNPLDGLSFAPAPVNAQTNNSSFNNGINNNQPFGGISLGFGGVSQPNQQQNIAQPLSFNNSQSFNNQQYSTNSFNGGNVQNFNNSSSGFNQSFANNNTNQANSFSPPSYNQQPFQSQQSPQHQQSASNNNMHQLESSMQKLDPFGDLGSLTKKTYSTTSPPKASTPSFTSPTNASASATTPPKKVNVDDLLDLLN